MSKEFSEYVRSGAFTLTLSERMIKVLLHIAGKGDYDDRLNLLPYQALHRRGLLSFTQDYGFSLTAEGKLVAELLLLAGYGESQVPEQEAGNG